MYYRNSHRKIKEMHPTSFHENLHAKGKQRPVNSQSQNFQKSICKYGCPLGRRHQLYQFSLRRW